MGQNQQKVGRPLAGGMVASATGLKFSTYCGINSFMDYAFKERIGNPDLFTGRKEELSYFLKWIDGIKQEKSQSTALLARRKMGKTALMHRLFNITFYKNNGVIPFYYEIQEGKMWIGDFCKEFFLTFIYQYIAFKSRKKEYLTPTDFDFKKAEDIAEAEGLPYLIKTIQGVEHEYVNEHVDTLWTLVRNAPRWLATKQDEFIVQMIDEFQFLNSMIYWDKGKSKDKLADTLAGTYLGTAESKVAPMLVSGSWVGWLIDLLKMMLPSRFRYKSLPNMPEEEAVEMVFNYSRFFEEPITDESAYLISALCEGSPFYISSIFRSECRGKDLTTIGGLTRTLEFETLDNHGIIKFTWMEYVQKAFKKVNDRNAKKIVLHLCKNNHRELTRKEILDDLELDMTDQQLELKLEALVKSDIISEGQTNYDYRGVRDNIFDKVFRGVYAKEILDFDVRTIKKEYKEELQKLKKKHAGLQGKHNRLRGLIAEYLLLEQLRVHAVRMNTFFKSITRYLPADFNFCHYARVWRYDHSPAYAKSFEIDIFARAREPGDYSLIVEVKSRTSKKFSKEEAVDFGRKFQQVKKAENLDHAIGFIFSRCGFTKEAEAYCKENHFACSDDERWLGDTS